MRHDRELIVLANVEILKLSPLIAAVAGFIIKRAARLGLSIKGRTANKK